MLKKDAQCCYWNTALIGNSGRSHSVRDADNDEPFVQDHDHSEDQRVGTEEEGGDDIGDLT